jgi:hypothetical protein
MGLIFKKLPSPMKPGFRGFLNWGVGVLLLNENRGGSLTPTGLVFSSIRRFRNGEWIWLWVRALGTLSHQFRSDSKPN